MPDPDRTSAPAFDLYRVMIFLLVIVIISRVHQHFELGALRPALLLVGLAGAYALLNPRTLNFKGLKTFPVAAILAMGMFAVISVPFGLSLGRSASYVLDEFSRVLLISLMVVFAIRHVRDLRRLVWAYVISAAVLVWMSLTVFDLEAGATDEFARLGEMYMYDANDAGLVLITAIPLCLLAYSVAGRVGKATAALILVGIGASIAYTGSRGAFISIAALGIVLLITHRGFSFLQRAGAVVALAAAMVVAAPEGYWEQMGTIVDIQEDYNWQSDVGRRAIAERGAGYMMDHPLTGVGIANFHWAEGTISEMARWSMPGVGIPMRAPHNSYVQAGAELGIPGGAAFLALVFGGMIVMLRLRRRVPPAWRTGDVDQRFLYWAPYHLSLSYIGFSVGCFFLSFAYLSPIYLLSAFAAGLVVLTRARLQEEASESTGRSAEPTAAFRPRNGMRGGLAVPAGPRS